MLDAFPPRFVEEERFPVHSLVPEDRELTRGVHRLVIVALDEAGIALAPGSPSSRAPFAVVHFAVAEPMGAEPSMPVVLVQPYGTFNGESAADSVPLVVVGAAPDALELCLEVSGDGGRFDAVLDPWRRYRLRGLPSGDHRIHVFSCDSAGLPVDAERMITLNRDAPNLE
jgi:hypothetical protein